MQYISIFSVLILSVLFIFTHGSSKLEDTWGFNITDGNCTNATVKDRVFYDHVEKVGIPLVVRTETEVYYGDPVIYCIIVSNQRTGNSPGSANITEGGVGHRYAVVELESERGSGMNFYVSIYAKK